MKRPVSMCLPPNSDAIRSARRICRLVESGEIMSIGWVTVRRGGDVSTGWDTAWGHTHHMTAGATQLQHRIVSANLASSEATK